MNGEELLEVANVALERGGLLAITDSRVIFLRKTLSRRAEHIDIDLSSIRSTAYHAHGELIIRLNEEEVIFKFIVPPTRARELAQRVQRLCVAATSP